MEYQLLKRIDKGEFVQNPDRSLPVSVKQEKESHVKSCQFDHKAVKYTIQIFALNVGHMPKSTRYNENS